MSGELKLHLDRLLERYMPGLTYAEVLRTNLTLNLEYSAISWGNLDQSGYILSLSEQRC